MEFSVKLLPVVLKDLKAIKQWYNKQESGLGEEFKKELNIEFDYISKYPLHYQCKYQNLRQSLIKRFPYSIFYLLEEDKKQIVIFGILHNSRNPEIIKRRKR